MAWLRKAAEQGDADLSLIGHRMSGEGWFVPGMNESIRVRSYSAMTCCRYGRAMNLPFIARGCCKS